MPGTKAGGIKARNTNLKLHGKDFYKRIGTKGGRSGHTGGFASNPELARTVGAIGGRKSKRKSENVKIINQNSKRIRELASKGVSYTDIARMLKVPYSSIIYWNRKERADE